MAETVIKTERLVLRPFSEKHLTETYVGWLNNKQLMRYSEQRHRDHDLEACRQYMNSFAGSPHYFWAVELADGSREHIGNINAYVDVNNNTADMGILIGAESARGKGYGLEAWEGVLRFLLDEKRVRKVTAGTMAVNKGMLRIMEKSGMEPDGRRKKQFVCSGEEVDAVYVCTFGLK